MSYLSVLLLLKTTVVVIGIWFLAYAEKNFRVVCEIRASHGSRYQGSGYVTSYGLVDVYEQFIQTVSLQCYTVSHHRCV